LHKAERRRLEGKDTHSLVRSVAKGTATEAIARVVKEHQAALARIDVKLGNVPKGNRRPESGACHE
jgi:hypothetical protein